MPTGGSTTRPFDETPVLEFARAFRTAARAVGFYPPTHQAVVSALDKVVSAARATTVTGPLCLTILPGAFLAGGVPIDSSETVVGELAVVLHRHGVGALNLDGRATIDSWRALFGLLARKPEDLRAAGGIQRQWKALRQPSPAILEVDFGALLRGQVGGDFQELAGIISHYLETAGVGTSLLDDPCAALTRAADNAADEPQAVAAILRELRAAAQLTWATTPEQFDDVFRRAAAVGAHLSVGIMAGLLEQRGSAEATIGTLDVVTALVERMSDTTLSQFLVKALGSEGAAPLRINEVITTLVPDAARRRRILMASQGVAFEGGVLEKWEELERNLEAHSDRQFVPERYAHELQSANTGANTAVRHVLDPPERIATWLQSIEGETVDKLDVQMLLDLARVETESVRAGAVLEILHGHVVEAADAGNWTDAARIAEAIRQVASESGDTPRRSSATDVLQKLGGSAAAQDALAQIANAEPMRSDAMTRLLGAIGPGLVPAIVARWEADSDASARSRLEGLVAACGEPGRRELRRVLGAAKDAPHLRVAAIRLLVLTGASEQASALEASLGDRHPDVRRAAFQALAAASTDRARDALVCGIARADAESQMALLEQVAALRQEQSVPLLARLLLHVDQYIVAAPVYLSIIAILRRVGSDEAAMALMLVFDRTRWRAPYRALQFRLAAASGLRAIGGPWAAAALRAMAGLDHLRSTPPAQAVTPATNAPGKTGAP